MSRVFLLQQNHTNAKENPNPTAEEKNTIGVVLANYTKVDDGYYIWSPMNNASIFLVDKYGNLRHRWTARNARDGTATYLKPNGNIICGATPLQDVTNSFRGGGYLGSVYELDYNSNIVWEFDYHDEGTGRANVRKGHWIHHDIEPMPNGNVLLLVWERMTMKEAIDAGRDPKLINELELWGEVIVEVAPDGKNGGRIVWEWKMFDHLVQNFDPTKNNYGDPKLHPRKMNVNYTQYDMRDPFVFNRGEERGGQADWVHYNSIFYNEETEEIILSSRNLSEIHVIDHSTTTEEAATSHGGKYGHGGDFLFRYGNPATYGNGDKTSRSCFGQHMPNWIPKQFPGEGNIIFYNNCNQGIGPETSRLTEVDFTSAYSKFNQYCSNVTTMSSSTNYIDPTPVWEMDLGKEFTSPFISGVHRLSNGNTFACAGAVGRFCEVTKEKEFVWKYYQPVQGNILNQGEHPTDLTKTPIGQFLGIRGEFCGTFTFRATKYPMNHKGIQEDKFVVSKGYGKLEGKRDVKQKKRNENDNA